MKICKVCRKEFPTREDRIQGRKNKNERRINAVTCSKKCARKYSKNGV